MKQSISIDLPRPPRVLSPNARPHVLLKARVFKETRLATRIITKNRLREAGFEGIEPKGDGLLNLQLVLTPPINRHRDEDNMIAYCKAVFDGIAEAVKVNDHFFHFREQVWNKAKSPGKLQLIIDWEDSNEG